MVFSEFVKLVNYGNASSSRSYSVLRDFESIEDAIIYKEEAEEHAAANGVGYLTIKIGDRSRIYEAGITSLESDISLTANAIRVELRYSFTTGQTIKSEPFPSV